MDSQSKMVIVYSSPAGSTRAVAEIILSELQAAGKETIVVNLDCPEDRNQGAAVADSLRPGDGLWIGSPVYAYHALPAVTDLIQGLPEMPGVFAVPFVTWGAVTSGMALREMSQTLSEKGCRIIGAAKVAAVHSMMWQQETPLADGRPDKIDGVLLRDWAKKLIGKMRSGKVNDALLSDLNYQPEAAQTVMREMNLAKARAMFPEIAVDADLCTRCGVCAENCPVQAVTLCPYPKIADHCICCFNCVRLCGENAFQIDLSDFGGRLRGMAKANSEYPLTKTFL